MTKLYNKIILQRNRSTLSSQRSTPAPSQRSVTTRSTSGPLSPATQSLRDDSNESPILSQLLAQGLCVTIAEAEPPPPPIGLTINRAPSDVSEIADQTDPQPTVHFPNPQRRIAADKAQDNCSAIAHHLFAHAKDFRFKTKVEVGEWCRRNISIDIIWWSSTISLVKPVGQKSCRLCATMHLIIRQNLLGSTGRPKMMLNLKSEMRGVCS